MSTNNNLDGPEHFQKDDSWAGGDDSMGDANDYGGGGGSGGGGSLPTESTESTETSTGTNPKMEFNATKIEIHALNFQDTYTANLDYTLNFRIEITLDDNVNTAPSGGFDGIDLTQIGLTINVLKQNPSGQGEPDTIASVAFRQGCTTAADNKLYWIEHISIKQDISQGYLIGNVKTTSGGSVTSPHGVTVNFATEMADSDKSTKPVSFVDENDRTDITVTFHNGNLTETTSILAGNSLMLSNSFGWEKTGHVLAGWSISNNSTITYEINTSQSFSEDIDLYAVW